MCIFWKLKLEIIEDYCRMSSSVGIINTNNNNIVREIGPPNTQPVLSTITNRARYADNTNAKHDEYIKKLKNGADRLPGLEQTFDENFNKIIRNSEFIDTLLKYVNENIEELNDQEEINDIAKKLGDISKKDYTNPYKIPQNIRIYFITRERRHRNSNGVNMSTYWFDVYDTELEKIRNRKEWFKECIKTDSMLLSDIYTEIKNNRK